MKLIYFQDALFSLTVMYGKHLRVNLETSLARTQHLLVVAAWSGSCCC